MDRSRIFPRLCRLLTAALTLTGVALRSVCLLAHFDPSVGYFNEGILPTLSDILYYLAVIAAITCAALIPKGTLPTELNTRLRRPVAVLWGLSLAAFTLGVLLVCYKDRTNTFLTVPMVMGILASLYFFLTGSKTGRYSDGLCALGFLPVFWCVASAWETYTDQFTAMNSPIKISLQMGFLGLALILVSELRFRLGKALPRVATALMSIGVFFSLNGAIPVLLGTGAHVLDNELHLFYSFVLLCGGVYGAFTLAQLLSPAEHAEVPAPTPEIPTESPNAE